MRSKLVYLFLLLIISFSLEWYSATKAFYTLGDVYEFWFYLITILFLVITLLYGLLRDIKNTVFISLFGYLLIVPFNLYLWQDFIDLKEESNEIILQLNRNIYNDIPYPEKLSIDYDERILYEKTDDGFQLYFHVLSNNTSHFYTSNKGWIYYPD